MMELLLVCSLARRSDVRLTRPANGLALVSERTAFTVVPDRGLITEVLLTAGCAFEGGLGSDIPWVHPTEMDCTETTASVTPRLGVAQLGSVLALRTG